MNRLIIVGNGFDLAHGKKTSYSDFLESYLRDALEEFRHQGIYDDQLLSINYSNYPKLAPDYFEEVNFQPFEVLEVLMKSPNEWNVVIKSPLFRTSFEKIKDLKWVDIETEYFDHLCKLQVNGNFDKKKVVKFNSEFDFFKKKLKEYLQKIDLLESTPTIEGMMEIFRESFKWSDFDTANLTDKEKRSQLFGRMMEGEETRPSSTLILNFNYTDTCEEYLELLYRYSELVNINYIHGSLKDEDIVFGFGDEHNKQYLSFEEKANNSIYSHVKSYWYFKSSRYRDLIRFLNSDSFQVFILGHSCGLSDRTMFREIFDHENCKSVKVYYYEKSDGKNDFFEKTVELGRHFEKKGLMRKMIEFDANCKIPQAERN